MPNLIEQAIACDDGVAAKIIQDALIESDDVVNYAFPKTWPDRERRPRIIGKWLQTEPRFLA